jgi:hypothetical protein
MSELEEHYLLRVPEAIADQLRAMIRDRKMPQHGVSFHLQSKFDIQVFSLVSTQLTKTKKKKKKKKKKKNHFELSTELDNSVREGVFRCGTESVRCSLLDLPHNVETFVTTDNVNFYKVLLPCLFSFANNTLTYIHTHSLALVC